MNTSNYTVVGELFAFEMYDILMLNGKGNEDEWFILRDSNNKIAKFTFEKRATYLSRPWDKLRTYEDEDGVHYHNIIYDSLTLDLWAKDLESLFNVIAKFAQPSTAVYKWLTEKNKEQEEVWEDEDEN